VAIELAPSFDTGALQSDKAEPAIHPSAQYIDTFAKLYSKYPNADRKLKAANYEARMTE